MRHPRFPALACLFATLLFAGPSLSDEPDPGVAEATVGSHGGLVRLTSGVEAGLLPGSARDGVGWHLLHLEAADPLLPPSEGVGPRTIDRRSTTPLGMVEGPPVSIGAGFRIRLLEPDPTGTVGTGMAAADEWNSWLEMVPGDLMPWLDPAYADQRKGFLVAVPNAAPEATQERVSVWLRSPGGLRKSANTDRIGAPRPGDDGIKRWDPCLLLGRLDASGTAWFYLEGANCGLDEAPIWTPLREQSQEEFAAWVVEQTPPKEVRKVRKELKAMAREEAKLEKEQ